MTKIKNLRKQKGLSQTEMSKIAGIVRARLSEIENGKGNPTQKTLKKIANALNCEIRDII
jgi:transcriptional regulator with XRE-family HTH domain